MAVVADTRVLTRLLRPRRPLRARQARAHRLRGQGVPARPGDQRHRGARAGARLLRRLPHPQGQDARRPAGAGRRRRAAARHRARRAAGALQHDPALQARARRRAAQAHARDRGCSRSSGRTRGGSRARRTSARSTATGVPRSPASRCVLVATDVGVDVFAPAESKRDGARRARRRRRSDEEAAEVLRVERGRPRYGVDLDDVRDPAGGRAQRARGVVHQGLLRRAGDGRAAVLPRQAEPPPARAAAVGARRDRRRAAARRASRSGGSGPSRSRPCYGPIALALVRREAAPGDTLAVGEGDVTAEVVELPFEG